MNNNEKCCLQGCPNKGIIPLNRIEGQIKIRKDLVGTYPREWKLCKDDFEKLVKTIRCCISNCSQTATQFEVTPSRRAGLVFREDCPHYQLCIHHAQKYSELADSQPIKREPEMPDAQMPPNKKQADDDSATECNDAMNSDTSTEVHEENQENGQNNTNGEGVKEEMIMEMNNNENVNVVKNEMNVENNNNNNNSNLNGVEKNDKNEKIEKNVNEKNEMKEENNVIETKEERDAIEMERIKEMLQTKEINQVTPTPHQEVKQNEMEIEKKGENEKEGNEVNEMKEEKKENNEMKETKEIKDLKESIETKMKEEVVEEKHCCISNCNAEVSGEVPIIQPLHFHICSQHLNKIIKLWKISLLQKQVVLDQECLDLIKENVGENNPLYQYTNPTSNDVKCALCCGLYSTEETYNCSFCPFTFCVECFKHLCLTLGCPQQFISNKARWKCFVCSRCEENQMQRNVFVKEQLMSLLEILKKKLDEGCLIGTSEDELKEFIESV